jgi:L-fuculose-phosphate aldolase
MGNDFSSIKENIIAKCRLLEEIGYFVGTWGNVSVRVPKGLIVTPSKVRYDTLSVDDFVTVSYDGTILSGHRLPSSETEIHRALYNKKDDIGAIIHSHSSYATAVSCLHKPIPAFIEDLVQIVGGQVQCTRYVPAGQHKKIAEEVAKTIGSVNAVLMANHGAICCGRDLDEAFVACQVVEKAALVMLCAGSIGKVIEIPDEFVLSERHRFLHKYGSKEDAH